MRGWESIFTALHAVATNAQPEENNLAEEVSVSIKLRPATCRFKFIF